MPGTLSAAQPLSPGSLVAGRYRIEQKIGSGGMGAVYKAIDVVTDELVALKVLLPHLLNGDSRAVQRFTQELLLAHEIKHDNVVRIDHLEIDRDLKFMVMEFVDGEDLAALQRARGALTCCEAVRIMSQACEGLAAAHQKGVIHRDLKPQNIMVTRDGRAVLTDLGIAQSPKSPQLTRAGSFVGTPDYASPEQVRGIKADARSDLFSIGVILYQLLTGKLPFPPATTEAALNARLTGTPEPPSRWNSEITATLDSIVLKCLATKPDLRYQTARALIADLASWDVQACEPRRSVPRKYIAIAASVIALSASAWWVRERVHRPNPMPKAVRVLVADLRNETGESLLDGTLEPLIAIALENSQFLTCFDRVTAHRLAGAMNPPAANLDLDVARLVALREGVDVTVSGAIEKQESGYRLSVQASEVASGRSLVQVAEDSDTREGLLSSVPRVAGGIRRALGDSTPESKQLDQETFTANSLEAAHAYVVAQQLQLAAKYDDAIEQYRLAIRLDPELGRAWAGLAAVCLNLGRTGEADQYFKEALAHSGRMTDREKYRTRGGYYITTGSYTHAVEEYSHLVREYPYDNAGHANLALAFFYLYDLPRALEEGRRAVQIYPKNVVQRNNVAFYLLYSGDFADAEKEARLVLRQNDKFEKAYVVLALSQFGRERRGEAVATWAKLRDISKRGRSYAATGLADSKLMGGRNDEAIPILQAAAEADITAGLRSDAGIKYAMLGSARLLSGDVTGAVAEADRALAASRDRFVLFNVARVYIAASRQDRLRQIVSELRGQTSLDAHIQLALMEGEQLLHSGRALQALQSFEAATKLGDSWLGRFDLARANIELGRFAEADSEIETCIKRRGEALSVFRDDRPTTRYYAPTYYYLGRAQEGLHIASREAYREFLSLKTNDGDWLVADTRRRLQQTGASH